MAKETIGHELGKGDLKHAMKVVKLSLEDADAWYDKGVATQGSWKKC